MPANPPPLRRREPPPNVPANSVRALSRLVEARSQADDGEESPNIMSSPSGTHATRPWYSALVVVGGSAVLVVVVVVVVGSAVLVVVVVVVVVVVRASVNVMFVVLFTAVALPSVSGPKKSPSSLGVGAVVSGSFLRLRFVSGAAVEVVVLVELAAPNLNKFVSFLVGAAAPRPLAV